MLLHLKILDPFIIAHYATIQASLFFSIILAAALSLLSQNTQRVFALLLFNCTLHLLLDSCQIKWGNGILLFVPLSWKITQFNLFWPEEPASHFMTAMGLLSLLFLWRKSIQDGIQLSSLTIKHRNVLLILLFIYLVTPFFFFHNSIAANNRYLTTLRNSEQRQGKIIEFDRVPYSASEKSMNTFSQETIFLSGNLPKQSSLLSIKGKFVTMKRIAVTKIHTHTIHRDWLSYLGLFLIIMLWAQTYYKRKTH